MKSCARRERSATLAWIGELLETNAARQRMRVDAETVSSEAFLFNVGAVLVRLALPGNVFFFFWFLLFFFLNFLHNSFSSAIHAFVP